MDDGDRGVSSEGDRTIALGRDDFEGDDAAFGLLTRGASLGRYLLLECVGRGGMGVVFRAYDPKLYREVALKIMRRGVRAGEEARIVREAQSMAQLSHPNVVAVYDVERVDDVLYIVMEFVPGKTLRQWLDDGHHDAVEVVAAMIQAGRGLAVAHGVGLVHRDFKPSNVIVGDDGRVRVMDFGLARSGGEAYAASASMLRGEPSSDSSQSLSAALTECGAVMGTPPYMAPEQHASGAVDGRADQYAFCVTLFEALWGVRPFVADDLDGLMALKQRASPRIPNTPRVPSWLQRLVLRGLSADPASRWPTMQVVVDALSNDPATARNRNRRTAIGAVTIASLAAGLVWFDGRDHRDDCVLEAAPQDFDSARRQALSESFLATGVGYADESATRVADALQRHAAAWRAEWQRECVAARRDHSGYQPSRCLATARVELNAVLDTLTQDVTVETVRNAASAVARLRRIGDCSHAREVDTADAAEVVAARAGLALADAQLGAGRHTTAGATLDGLEGELTALGQPDLLAEFALARASVAEAAADFERAEARGFDAFVAALEIGRDDLAARASSLLLRVIGVELARREDGQRWARQAHALVNRVDSGGELAIALAHDESTLQLATGKTQDALASVERGAALAERQLGADSLVTARMLNHMANVLDTLGQVERAKASYERSLAILEAQLGPAHPDVIRPLSNLGNVYLAQNQAELALTSFERAIAVLESSSGAEHPDVAMLQYNAADALSVLGRRTEARGRLERTIEILLATLGPEHPSVAYPLTTLGRMLGEDGELDAARPKLERALVIREQNREPPPLVAETRLVLAELLWHSEGDRARAHRLVAAAEADCRDQPEATCKTALELVAQWRAERPE